MWPRSTSRDQLVAHAPRERKVGDPVAMKMSKLAPPNPELNAAKPMWADLDPGP